VNLEVIYGRNPVRELIAAGRRPVREVFVLASLAEETWPADARVRVGDRAALGHACGSGDHQGVVALADPYPYVDPRSLVIADGPVVCLDGAQDPRNFGAICRVADAAGAGGIVIPRRGSPGVTSVVCKASAGAVEHLAVAQVDSVAGFLGEMRDAGWTTIGADPGGDVDYRVLGSMAHAVVVMGAEGAGLRPSVLAACDRRARIPMRGHVASLNISIAAALLLFEVQRAID
jgi:23S rRNA (guanosine2251-2'-O)-methyltransferase